MGADHTDSNAALNDGGVSITLQAGEAKDAVKVSSAPVAEAVLVRLHSGGVKRVQSGTDTRVHVLM